MHQCNVNLRTCDMESIRLIADYLQRHGLVVGKRSVSQAVRFALDLARESIGAMNAIESDSHGITAGSQQ